MAKAGSPGLAVCIWSAAALTRAPTTLLKPIPRTFRLGSDSCSVGLEEETDNPLPPGLRVCSATRGGLLWKWRAETGLRRSHNPRRVTNEIKNLDSFISTTSVPLLHKKRCMRAKGIHARLGKEPRHKPDFQCTYSSHLPRYLFCSLLFLSPSPLLDLLRSVYRQESKVHTNQPEWESFLDLGVKACDWLTFFVLV